MRKLVLTDMQGNLLNNFLKIEEEIALNVFSRFRGKHTQLTFSSAVTNAKIKHLLRGIPKDIIVTGISDPSITVTFNFDKFDNENLDITTSGAVTIRFLMGSFT